MQAAVFGSSGGIGSALVRLLIEQGKFSRVWAGSRSGTALIDGAEPFAFDLLDETSVAAAAGLIGASGPLGLVIVATGLLSDGAAFRPEKSWAMQDADNYARAFAINATGPALIGKHMLPLLDRNQRSVFAALSARVGSISDNRLGGWHAYRASKAALNMIVRNFALELASKRPGAIAVALHPGTVATALSRPFVGAADNRTVFSPQDAAGHLLKVIGGLVPADSGCCLAWDGAKIPF